MNNKKIYIKLIFLYLIFLLIVAAIPGGEFTQLMGTLLSVVTFLFALFLAFSVTNRQHRLKSIRQLLRVDDGIILNCYQLMQTFPVKATKEFRNLLDKYLIKQIDYFLVDFDQSDKEFKKIYDFILNLPARNDFQKQSKMKLIENMQTLSEDRKRLLYNIHDKMLVLEWIALLGLYGSFLFLIFSINDQSGVALFIIPLVGSVMGLLLMILQSLNNLRWQESYWIWKQLSSLFGQLGLKPYFCEDIISSGRFRKKEVKKLKEYRLATFPNKYPNMTGKKIKIVKNK